MWLSTCVNKRFAQERTASAHEEDLVTLGNYGGFDHLDISGVWFGLVLLCVAVLSSPPSRLPAPAPTLSSEIHPLLPGIQEPFPTCLPHLTSSLSVLRQGHIQPPESHFYPVLFLENSFLRKMIITIIMQYMFLEQLCELRYIKSFDMASHLILKAIFAGRVEGSRIH